MRSCGRCVIGHGSGKTTAHELRRYYISGWHRAQDGIKCHLAGMQRERTIDRLDGIDVAGSGKRCHAAELMRDFAHITDARRNFDAREAQQGPQPVGVRRQLFQVVLDIAEDSRSGRQEEAGVTNGRGGR